MKDSIGALVTLLVLITFVLALKPETKEILEKVDPVITRPVRVLVLKSNQNPIKKQLYDTITEVIPEFTQHFNLSSDELKKVITAQIILETGWLKSEAAIRHNNVLGLKPKNTEASTKLRGWEVINGIRVDMTMDFRTFANKKACIKAYFVDFIMNSRYKTVRLANNPEQYFKALQDSGYATDPLYAKKLINIYKR